MRKERVNINLDNNNKKIGLVDEELPKATVSLRINDHPLKFAIGNELDDKHFPPAPPNSCNGAANAASYAALVVSNSEKNPCGSTDTYSQLRVESEDLENTHFGIKVQGSAGSDLKIEVDEIDTQNLDSLHLLMGDEEIDLSQALHNLTLNQDGLDLLLVHAIQHGFLIGDLDGDSMVTAPDALLALKAAVGMVTIDHDNKVVINEGKTMDDGAYNRFEKTWKYLNDYLVMPMNSDGDKFVVSAVMALALLKISVQLNIPTDWKAGGKGMPPNQKEE